MDYAKAIEEAVTRVELATGKNQGEISVDLGYAANYISLAIGRGGTKKLLDKIHAKYAEYLQPFSAPPPAVDQYEQALIKALVTDYIKLKASITKKSVDEIADELDQNTKLILRDMKK